jgi:beta-ureidopropionase
MSIGPEGWYSLRKQECDVIVWPSAFPGGRMLNSWAWITQSYIVTSTWPSPSRVIDKSGDELASTGRYGYWTSASINLESRIIHMWPYEKKMDALHNKYKSRISIKKCHYEGWGIVSCVDPSLQVESILQEFEIPTHRQHIAMADKKQSAFH